MTAVREQAKAASHVVELMERVRGGVEQIRGAAAEQDRGNEVVPRQQHGDARGGAAGARARREEQARGSGRIRESVEGVREAVEQINRALQEQSAACRSAVEFLEAVYARTRSNEESSRRLDAVAKSLLHQAEALRQDVAAVHVLAPIRRFAGARRARAVGSGARYASQRAVRPAPLWYICGRAGFAAALLAARVRGGRLRLPAGRLRATARVRRAAWRCRRCATTPTSRASSSIVADALRREFLRRGAFQLTDDPAGRRRRGLGQREADP